MDGYTPNSQLPTPNSQLPTPNSQLPNSQLPTPNSQLPTPNSQLPTPNSSRTRWPSGAASAVVAFLLGAVLLSAAVLKGHDLATLPVLDDAMLTARWLWLAVVDFEAVLGAWLLLIGFAPRWVWKLTVGCFAALACAAAWKGFSGAASCDCFGRLSASVNPWHMVLADLGAAAVTLLCWRHVSLAHTAPPAYARWLAAGAIVMAVPASVAIGLNAPRPATLSSSGVLDGVGRTVLLKPEEWIGERFPLLEHIELGRERADLSTGTWGIVVYSRDCPKCEAIRAVLEGLADKLIASQAAPRLAFVELSIAVPALAAAVPAWRGGVAGRLRPAHEWFVETPTVVVVRDSVVRRVFVGIEPSTLASVEAAMRDVD